MKEFKTAVHRAAKKKEEKEAALFREKKFEGEMHLKRPS